MSDQLAAMVGGIGIARANISYRSGHAIFETTHGTAPNLCGEKCGQSLFHHSFGCDDAPNIWDGKKRRRLSSMPWSKVSQCSCHTRSGSRFMTGGVSLSTSVFTEEIVGRIEQ